MFSYNKIAMRYLGKYIEPYLGYFSDLKNDLKKSGMRTTLLEYLSSSILTCIILFVLELPLFAFIFSIIGLGALFSLFMAVVVAIGICVVFFLAFINYPKFIIHDKAKSIENTLPFAGIYLSTIASSQLPPHKIFEIFSKFKEHGEISKEAERIVTDMKAFGLNIYESLEKAVNRTPSKELKELFWSMLSTLKSGGNLDAYLTEKSKTFLDNYRRKLTEFSHSLSIYLEIYLTALVLGAIFFTILTSLMSGFGGVGINVVFIQFFLIFLFIPLISAAFIILIKMSSPGAE
ncbi:MAG: type II secretion system F family protein [Candidatus Aenigmarchaeota archaeon]|nr:type II secretion system F family protein [Candidatus Aenigmarchaeota archaeon]